jgi:hypothetical protein
LAEANSGAVQASAEGGNASTHLFALSGASDNMPLRSGGEAAGKGQAWTLKIAGELHLEWSLHPRGGPEKPKAMDQNHGKELRPL